MQGWLKPRKTAAPAPEKAGHGLPESVELQLLAGIRHGRRADFDTLYRLYHPRITRFLVHLLRDAELVDEVLDDTLMVVWQRATSFDGRSKLSTWIFGIAYRKAMKAVARFDSPLPDEDQDARTDPGPGPEQQFGLGQLRERLQQALGELSMDHRAVVELCYFQDMSHAEIAAVVGCPTETVKTRMFYARRRLRGLLADLGETE